MESFRVLPEPEPMEDEQSSDNVEIAPLPPPPVLEPDMNDFSHRSTRVPLSVPRYKMKRLDGSFRDGPKGTYIDPSMIGRKQPKNLVVKPLPTNEQSLNTGKWQFMK
ncbi:hypothetical protein Ciccas_001007 [Cichlidogyrus casuarinus]|uniref:Uncharacterized protein n=1 Tax=Cichlidogyrus casuarinus TaxID=1844966 RepID=A0ABD2QLB6_9PLAT